MTKEAGADPKRTRPVRGLGRQRSWSLLETQWLDVPVGEDARYANLSWGAFAEAFDVCLQGVSAHVARRVDDQVRLGSVVTEVFTGNLDVLVSPLGNRDKLQRLLAAADRLIEGGCHPPGPD